MMPWFAWLFLALAFGMVAGSLLLLRDSANKMPVDEEALQRMKARNAALDQQDDDDTKRSN